MNALNNTNSADGSRSKIDAREIVIEPAPTPAAVPVAETSAAIDPGQGGKGGDGAGPALPPSPPSTSTDAKNATLPSEAFEDEGGIYRAAPIENPVLTALRSVGAYRGEVEDRTHRLACPWASEHDAPESVAFYKEPSSDAPSGSFQCPDCHKRGRTMSSLLDHLGVDHAAARGKAVIRVVKGDLDGVIRAAERVLAKVGGYFQSNGMIVRIRIDPLTGDVTTEQVNEHSLSIALSVAADWESHDGRSKQWSRIDVPQRIVTTMLKSNSFAHLPPLKGLARQPFLRRTETAFVCDAGYDVTSGMYATFDETDYAIVDPTREDALAALDRLKALLSEFHFAQTSDRAAALSAIC